MGRDSEGMGGGGEGGWISLKMGWNEYVRNYIYMRGNQLKQWIIDCESNKEEG